MRETTVAVGIFDFGIHHAVPPSMEPAKRLPKPFGKSRRERQQIVTSVGDRLVGNLDSSLRAARALCSSLDFGLPRETGKATKNSS